MGRDLSLRERKKRETRERIADVAMGLFMLRGFEKVTVAEVATAADVSVNTVFNYFSTKEDLFFDRQDTAIESLGRVVTARRPGESVVDALRRDFREAAEARDWRYGINEGAADFNAIIEDSPSLVARVRELHRLSEDHLAGVLADETDADPDDPMPRLVAAQAAALVRTVAAEFTRRRRAGEPTAVILPSVRAAAERAFDIMESGIGRYPGG